VTKTLDDIFQEIEARKIKFSHDDLREALFERVCYDLKTLNCPMTQEIIADRMIVYVTEVLDVANSIYETYDKNMELILNKKYKK